MVVASKEENQQEGHFIDIRKDSFKRCPTLIAEKENVNNSRLCAGKTRGVVFRFNEHS
jgi:hypothetical protein